MKEHPDLEIVSGLVDIPVHKLCIRYIPVVTPLELWNSDDGYDMSLKNSPHVDLISGIKEYGIDWDVLQGCNYWKERLHRYKIGFKDWTKKKIKEHIKRRWAIYKSLKKYGYRHNLRKNKKGEEKPVIVLKEPFWKTRFGLKLDWLDGKEIWDGGGICTAAYVLGYDTIPGYYAKDRYPGSLKKGEFEYKLRFCEDRWEEIF